MITINIEKAKAVAHHTRRAAREVEFKPFDAIIAKQIPGPSAAEAEAARQAIREKYVEVQADIDAATEVAELSVIVASLN
jgi:hypothetical protein